MIWNRAYIDPNLVNRCEAQDAADRGRYRPCQYNLNPGPWEPVSGATLAILDLVYDTFKGVGEIGSEFVYVPYVGQKRTGKTLDAAQPVAQELRAAEGSPQQAVYRPARATNGSNETILGFRAAQGVGRIVKAAARAPG